MNKAELQQRIADIQWYHSIDLGNGIVTPGHSNQSLHRLQQQWNRFNLPDLNGKTLLDIGAFNGFYTFEAEKHGALATALDSFRWSDPPNGLGASEGVPNKYNKAGFNLAHAALESQAESIHMEVCDMCPETVGKHDVVLFLGVLYHLRYPLLALERVASVANDLVVIETQYGLNDVQTPAMEIYPGSELDNNPVNWCAPNIPGVIALMKMAGLHDCKVIHTIESGNNGRVILHGHSRGQEDISPNVKWYTSMSPTRQYKMV